MKRKNTVKLFWCIILVAFSFVGCSSSEKAEEDDDDKVNSRKAKPQYQELAEKFATAFVNKDYETGYSLLSDAFQRQTSFADFAEGVGRYRDAFEGSIEAGFMASDDPQEMPEFVAESERRYLVENITIEFEGKIDGDEGAFFCTLWIIDNGTPKIARFYLED